MAHPAARRLWRAEIMPSFTPPGGVDLESYADVLLERFRNLAIHHRTWQIAMNGSQKLPQRILGTLNDNRVAGRPSPGLLVAVAAWMRYVAGVDEQGRAIDVRGPLAARLKRLSDNAATVEAEVSAFLSVAEVFPRSLATDPSFRTGLATAYQALLMGGARVSVARQAAASN